MPRGRARRIEAANAAANDGSAALPALRHPLDREALRHALFSLDQPESAHTGPPVDLGLWQDLVAGRFAILQHFERDGVDYYFALRRAGRAGRGRTLSARESQVLLLANLGLSNKAIAHTLTISISTASKYLARARKKLGAEVAPSASA